MKALINERGERYPHTHDLDLLVVKLRRIEELLPTLPVALGNLTDYAMTLRYEGSERLPESLDRQACIGMVELLRLHVRERIQTLSPPVAP